MGGDGAGGAWQNLRDCPYLLVDDEEDAERIAAETFRYCVEQLGKPAEQKPGFFVWNTTDASIILRTEQTADQLRVGLVLTSSCLRNLRRL